MKQAILLSSVLLFSLALSAQQEPLFTNYIFNSLVFNPAYAGTTDYLTTTLIHRSQWLGWNSNLDGDGGGTPSSQSISLHSPVNNRVGLGLHFLKDAVGANRTNSINAVYAYHIPLQYGKLSIGIQAGATKWRANWRELNFKDEQALDPAFAGDIVSDWVPNVGLGVYYYYDLFYIGLSAPRIMRFSLSPRRDFTDEYETTAHLYPHFYLTAGGIYRYGPDLVLKPTLLIRRTGVFENVVVAASQRTGTPTAVDLGMSAFMLETLWFGTTYRLALEGRSSHDSMDFWTAVQFSNGLRLGMSYDILLSKLRSYSSGSMELMLGYDFNYKVSRVESPRYF